MADGGHLCLRIGAARQKGRLDLGQFARRHVKRQRRAGRQRFGNGAIGLVGGGGDHQPLRHPPRGQRTAEAGGGGRGGGDAGNDLDRKAKRPGAGDFLARAAKDRGVTGFEPHHMGARNRLGQHQRRDPRLRPGIGAHLFANRNTACGGGDQRKDVLCHQPVIQDEIGLLQAAQRAQRQKIGGTGAGANQRNPATRRGERGSHSAASSKGR